MSVRVFAFKSVTPQKWMFLSTFQIVIWRATKFNGTVVIPDASGYPKELK